jgi:hypothetical protein
MKKLLTLLILSVLSFAASAQQVQPDSLITRLVGVTGDSILYVPGFPYLIQDITVLDSMNQEVAYISFSQDETRLRWIRYSQAPASTARHCAGIYSIINGKVDPALMIPGGRYLSFIEVAGMKHSGRVIMRILRE